MNKIHFRIKLIIIITAIIIIAMPIKKFATATTKVYLEVPASGNSSDTITVVVKTTGSSEGLTGIQGTLNYDKNQLEYISNTIIKEKWFVSGFNQNTGIFLLEVNDISDTASFIYEDTEIASFTFKIKDSAVAGNTSITLTDIVAPGASELENTETSENISINGGQDKNSENIEAISADINASASSGTSTNSNTNTNISSTTSTIPTSMPYTGVKDIISTFIIGLFIIGLVFGIGYHKYKDV